MGFFMGFRATPFATGTPWVARGLKTKEGRRPGNPGRETHFEAFSYFLLKRSTRPAVSTSFCLPV